MDLQQHDNPIPVSSIEFEKVYMVMDKRLELGYSDTELSFLLGYRAQYVRDAEDPRHKLKYSSKDTNYLIEIFGCKLKDIIPPKLSEAFYHIHIETTINEDGSISYKIYREFKSPRRVICRAFTAGTVISPIASPAVDAAQIQMYVRHLFSNDYFTMPRTSLEVFQKCMRKFGKPLQPEHLAKALQTYTSKRKVPKLLQNKNSSSRTTYLKDG